MPLTTRRSPHMPLNAAVFPELGPPKTMPCFLLQIPWHAMRAHPAEVEDVTMAEGN